MDNKQRQESILAAQRLARGIQRRLAEEESFSSAHYRVVMDIERMLQEQQDLLIQLKEDLRDQDSSAQECPAGSKRGRGGVHQNYLLDNSGRSAYVQRIREIFQTTYDSSTRRFVLPGEMGVRAPLFLACLYDLGIERGLASDEAPVKDFAEIVREAAADIPNFTTAYNTIQSVIREWRSYVGNRGYFDRTIHLYNLSMSDVVENMRDDFALSQEIMRKISTYIYNN